MSIFNRATDLQTLRSDRLLRVAADYFPDVDLSDSYLWLRLTAEERALEVVCRTLFQVREVVPTGISAAELADVTAAATAAGFLVLEEPGYDYDPRFFSGEAWGLLHLRHKPIVQVRSLVFAYPNPSQVLMTIPADWIRPDKKYGVINIVPGTDTAINLPANAYILTALGGGRTIPFMIQVRYQAGMPNIREDRPDIIDLIFKMTVMGILEDQFLPTSGSSSLDGLSQSLSYDAGKMRDLVASRIESVSSSLNGIKFLAF